MITWDSCHVAAQRSGAMLGALNKITILPANWHITVVEPRGFEPLTSAVQSQIHNVVVVRGCSEIPALPWWHTSWVFAVVRVGWCTTGVSGGLRARFSFLPLFPSFQSSPTVVLRPTPVVFCTAANRPLSEAFRVSPRTPCRHRRGRGEKKGRGTLCSH